LATQSGRGGFALFLGNASSTFFNVVTVLIIARLLGPASYGLYAIVLAIPGIAVNVADLGMSSSLTRYSARLKAQADDSKLSVVIETGLTLNLVTSAFALFAILISSNTLALNILTRPDAANYLRLTSMLIPASLLVLSTCATLVGSWKMKQASLIMILQSLVKVILSPLLILFGLGILGALLGHILGYVASAVLGLVLVLRYRQRLSTQPERTMKHKEAARMMLNYGLPVYLATLMTMLLLPYQNLVLAHFVSDVEIGNYNASVNFSAAINLIAYPLTNVLFPIFSKTDITREIDHLRHVFRLSVKYASLLIVPVAIGFMVLSKEVIVIIYGSSYSTAHSYLSAYMGLFLLTGVGYLVVGNLFNGLGDTKETLKMMAITILVFVPTAPIMAKYFQVLGVIAVLVSSTLIGNVYGLKKSMKKYGVRLELKGLMGIYAASAISAAPALVLTQVVNWHPVIKLATVGPLYLVTYLTAIPFLGAVDQTDVSNLSQIMGGVDLVKPLAKQILSYEAKLIRMRKNLSLSARGNNVQEFPKS